MKISDLDKNLKVSDGNIPQSAVWLDAKSDVFKLYGVFYDADGEFDDITPDVMLTMTGTYQNGEVMGQLVVPNTTPDYIKAVLTAGTALTGKVDVYLQYLAR